MNEEMHYEGDVTDTRGNILQVYTVGRPSLENLDQFQMKDFLKTVYSCASAQVGQKVKEQA